MIVSGLRTQDSGLEIADAVLKAELGTSGELGGSGVRRAVIDVEHFELIAGDRGTEFFRQRR
jgi:hypothetical protein